jgi:single-stranded DNA-binding protein
VDYKTVVKMIGTLVSKRLNTKPKEPVLNLFVRTGTSRGSKFCISVNIWGKQAKLLNKAIREATDGVKDGETIEEDEAPVLKIKGELRYDFWENEDGETVGRHSVTASRVIVEDHEDEDDDEDE